MIRTEILASFQIIRISSAIILGFMMGSLQAIAQTTFNGGDIYSSANWSNGLPSVSNPGTIATNGTMNGVFDFNQNTTGTVTINITGGTLTAIGANFFNGPTNVAPGWATFNWLQTGGNLVVTNGTFAPNLRMTYTLAGGTMTQSSGGTILCYNSGTFNQTGGTANGVGFTFTDGALTLKTHTFSGGQGVDVPRFVSETLQNVVIMDGNYRLSLRNTALTSDVGSANGGTINFLPTWTGNWTRDNFTVADWETVMTKNGMLFNGTQITLSNFSSVFQVIDAGTVGSRITIVPEPASMMMVGGFVLGVITVRRRRSKK